MSGQWKVLVTSVSPTRKQQAGKLESRKDTDGTSYEVLFSVIPTSQKHCDSDNHASWEITEFYEPRNKRGKVEDETGSWGSLITYDHVQHLWMLDEFLVPIIV